MDNFLESNRFSMLFGSGALLLLLIWGLAACESSNKSEQMKQETQAVISTSETVSEPYLLAKNHLIRISADEQIVSKLAHDKAAVFHLNRLPVDRRSIIIQQHPEIFRFDSPLCLRTDESTQTICVENFINEFKIGIFGQKSPLYTDLVLSLSNIREEITKLLLFYANHPNRETEYRKAARQMEAQANLSDWYEFAMSIDSGDEHLVQEILNKNRDSLLNIPQLDKRLEKLKLLTLQRLRKQNSIFKMDEEEIFDYLAKEWEKL